MKRFLSLIFLLFCVYASFDSIIRNKHNFGLILYVLYILNRENDEARGRADAVVVVDDAESRAKGVENKKKRKLCQCRAASA